MLAAELMIREVVTISADQTVRELVNLLEEKDYSGFPVLDHTGHAVGVVSQTDILRALAFTVGAEKLPPEFQERRRKASTRLLEVPAEGPVHAVPALLALPVRDIMTPSVESCTVDTPVAEVCALMTDHRVRRVVVLDDEQLVVGIITDADLVRCLGEKLK